MAFAPITRLFARRAGTPSGRSSLASYQTTSTPSALRAWCASASTQISYRRHHRYLTTVADHKTGAIVRRGARPQQRRPCRASSTSSATSPTRSGRGSIDMSGWYAARRPLSSFPTPRSASSYCSTSSASAPAPPTKCAATHGMRHQPNWHTRHGALDQVHPMVAAQGARQPKQIDELLADARTES